MFFGFHLVMIGDIMMNCYVFKGFYYGHSYKKLYIFLTLISLIFSISEVYCAYMMTNEDFNDTYMIDMIYIFRENFFLRIIRLYIIKELFDEVRKRKLF